MFLLLLGNDILANNVVQTRRREDSENIMISRWDERLVAFVK